MGANSMLTFQKIKIPRYPRQKIPHFGECGGISAAARGHRHSAGKYLYSANFLEGCAAVQSTKFDKFCTWIEIQCSPQAKILKIRLFLLILENFSSNLATNFAKCTPSTSPKLVWGCTLRTPCRSMPGHWGPGVKPRAGSSGGAPGGG